MIRITHVLVISAAVVGISSCSKTVGRVISPNQIGGKYARLTGYMGTSAAAPGGRHEEQTAGSIRHDVVLDEATLASLDANETCFDVIVRTESDYDEPLEQLAPSCETDGRKSSGVVEGEVISVVDYSYMGTQSVVQAEGVTATSYLGLSIDKPAEKVFRVIQRKGRLCCPVGGHQRVALELANERREVASWDYKLDFEWTIR